MPYVERGDRSIADVKRELWEKQENGGHMASVLPER